MPHGPSEWNQGVKASACIKTNLFMQRNIRLHLRVIYTFFWTSSAQDEMNGVTVKSRPRFCYSALFNHNLVPLKCACVLTFLTWWPQSALAQQVHSKSFLNSKCAVKSCRVTPKTDFLGVRLKLSKPHPIWLWRQAGFDIISEQLVASSSSSIHFIIPVCFSNNKL